MPNGLLSLDARVLSALCSELACGGWGGIGCLDHSRRASRPNGDIQPAMSRRSRCAARSVLRTPARDKGSGSLLSVWLSHFTPRTAQNRPTNAAEQGSGEMTMANPEMTYPEMARPAFAPASQFRAPHSFSRPAVTPGMHALAVHRPVIACGEARIPRIPFHLFFKPESGGPYTAPSARLAPAAAATRRPKELSNGQQNVDRRHPPGRDPCGSGSRQSRRGIRLRIRAA